MRIGITLPQYELEPGRDSVLDFVQAADQADFDHIVVYDHILGVDRSSLPGWRGPYDAGHQFHEANGLAGFHRGSLEARVGDECPHSAAALRRPRGQTSCRDRCTQRRPAAPRCRHRVEPAEITALGGSWERRGSLLEEQVALMRELWTKDVAHFDGRFHHVDGLGISPRPVQRPIPVWLGGGIGASDITFRRIGRIADGWMPNLMLDRDDEAIDRALNVIRQAAAHAGRGEESVALDGQLQVSPDMAMSEVRRMIERWEKFGARRVTLRLLDEGLSSRAHIAAVSEIGDALGLASRQSDGHKAFT